MEEIKQAQDISMRNEDTFNRTIAIAIALVSLLTAVVAFLQGDAAARDDRANRDSKRYALEALGKEVSGDARVNLDYSMYDMLNDLELQAFAAEQRGDETAANRYRRMAQEALSLSPLFKSPYYSPQQATDASPNISQYEADTYLVEITALREKFLAASAVKEGWDYKANTYIIHITLFAVSLFMFGLSTTIGAGKARKVLATAGTFFALAAVIWAGILYTKPVFDLRQQGAAIDHYAKGVGLAHQNRNTEAITMFDQALAAYPDYIEALIERSNSHSALENYDAAVRDLEKALSLGEKRPSIAGELAWLYYITGRFDEAIATNQFALQSAPNELWIHFDLALALLAAGQTDAAQEAYKLGMATATGMVSQADQERKEPSSYIWWGLQDGADSLAELIDSIQAKEKYTPAEKAVNPEKIITEGNKIVADIKSLALALEYTDKPPVGALSAKISPLSFAEPEYNEQDELTGHSQPTDTFPAGLQEIVVLFDYAGVKDGSEYILKLYVNGEEDPSWRIVEIWNLGGSGSAEIPLSYAYSDVFHFAAGEYIVELYFDKHLASRGKFYVSE